MVRIFGVLLAVVVVAVLALGGTGCSSDSPPKDKKGKMEGDKMAKDKMEGDKMTKDKMEK